MRPKYSLLAALVLILLSGCVGPISEAVGRTTYCNGISNDSITSIEAHPSGAGPHESDDNMTSLLERSENIGSINQKVEKSAYSREDTEIELVSEAPPDLKDIIINGKVATEPAGQDSFNKFLLRDGTGKIEVQFSIGYFSARERLEGSFEKGDCVLVHGKVYGTSAGLNGSNIFHASKIIIYEVEGQTSD